MKSINIFSSLLIFFQVILTISGFSQECLWSSHAGGWSYDGGRQIVSDKYGNKIVVGITQSSACYFNTDTITSGWFIVKYDVSGNESWVIDLVKSSGPNEGEWGNIAMKIDTINDQLLLTGTFYNFLNLPDTVIHEPKNTIFVIKMDLDGNIIWCRTAGGTGDDQAFGIASDPDGNIYISGSNENDATFDQITIPRGGFLAKYDANGNVIWAKHKFRFLMLHSSGYPFTEASPIHLLYSNNSLLVNGVVQNDTIVIDTVTFINSYSFNASYLSSFSSQGDFQWIKLAGGPGGSCGSSFATDTLNNIYISGFYQGKGVFGNDTLIPPGDGGDCFLAKYNSLGNLIWVTSTQSSSMAWGQAVAYSSDAGVYLSGYFHGTIHVGDIILVSSPTSNDMFLAKYSTDGNNIGVRQYHSGAIYGVALDGSKSVCFTGDFNDTLTIGPNTFVSRGQGDLFVAKCSPILGGVKSLSAESNQLLIYANPTTGICNITIPEDFKNEKSLSLTIINSQGKVIQKVPVEITEERISLNIQAQAAGMYNVILTNGKKSYTGKIVFK